MKWDPLLHWMSHVGEGSWASFRRMVRTIDEEASTQELQRLRNRLSELAVAEFFVDGTSRWRALRPLLAGSRHRESFAFLCGGRTPELVDGLRAHASRLNGHVFELSVDGLFSSVQVHGRINDISIASHIEYEADIVRRLSSVLVPIHDVMTGACVRAPPHGWGIRSFDTRSARWIEGNAASTALEYTSPYHQRIFLLPRGASLVEIPKREAVYAAAILNRVALARYNASTREFSIPLGAPLPEPYARTAALASGRPSIVRGNSILYEEIPARLATVLLVLLGQLPPPNHHGAERSGSRTFTRHFGMGEQRQ